MKKILLPISFLISISFISCSSVDEITVNETFTSGILSLNANIDSFKTTFHLPRSTKLENSFIDTLNKIITLEFNRDFAVIPFREHNVDSIYGNVKNYFGEQFTDYKYLIKSLGLTIEELIPNYNQTEKLKYDQ